MILTAFVLNEHRSRNPLFPLSIFRVKGLAAADATQLIALAGFFAMFFFLTLYMQKVLGFSPIQAGAAYLPVTVGLAVASGVVIAAVHPDRYPAGDRRRRAAERRRDLLPLQDPGPRLLRLRRAPRTGR